MSKMRAARLLPLVGVTAISFSDPTFGYTELSSASRALQATPFGETYIGLDQRQEMARAILEYWTDLDERLPRISPSEREWLQEELDTTDSIRLNRVLRSREYNLWELENLTDLCLQSVRGLLDSVTTQTEMFFWTRIANCYHRSDGDIFRFLQGAGLDDQATMADGFTLDNMILSAILVKVIPSSMADAMNWTISED